MREIRHCHSFLVDCTFICQLTNVDQPAKFGSPTTGSAGIAGVEASAVVVGAVVAGGRVVMAGVVVVGATVGATVATLVTATAKVVVAALVDTAIVGNTATRAASWPRTAPPGNGAVCTFT